ncbi:retrovirus-related Pol polyprotein from transposon opus [Trichonephila clavipes]|uniref:Retrovirus-related Pol polyprotein from transposon opus n=1 Tax=Trichonephila clavipes TaxID=2585209 RepID=A0A8X6V8P5_TRICX|nr:retrovirus-related Pol polyprotein from transposon opus [Trichonephila clavipes]
MDLQVCVCGVPAKLVTDQGRQFEAELFRSIAAICGAKVAHTTSYHPQCNGKVERLHRTLKGAIKAHNNIRWTKSLPTVLLGLRAAIYKT